MSLVVPTGPQCHRHDSAAGRAEPHRRTPISNAEFGVPVDPSTPFCSKPGHQDTGYRDPVAYSYLDLVSSSHVSGRAVPGEALYLHRAKPKASSRTPAFLPGFAWWPWRRRSWRRSTHRRCLSPSVQAAVHLFTSLIRACFLPNMGVREQHPPPPPHPEPPQERTHPAQSRHGPSPPLSASCSFGQGLAALRDRALHVDACHQSGPAPSLRGPIGWQAAVVSTIILGLVSLILCDLHHPLLPLAGGPRN